MADKGSSVMVKGKINAPPVVGPKPGRTPRIKPKIVPRKSTTNNFVLNKGANIK